MTTETQTEERTTLEVLSELRRLSEVWYWQAFRAGAGAYAHGFVEFFGLWNELLDIYQDLAKLGHEPNQLTNHSNRPLPVAEHQVDYLIEKLNCVFGPLLRGLPAKTKERAVHRLFGVSITR